MAFNKYGAADNYEYFSTIIAIQSDQCCWGKIPLSQIFSVSGFQRAQRSCMKTSEPNNNNTKFLQWIIEKDYVDDELATTMSSLRTEFTYNVTRENLRDYDDREWNWNRWIRGRIYFFFYKNGSILCLFYINLKINIFIISFFIYY